MKVKLNKIKRLNKKHVKIDKDIYVFHLENGNVLFDTLSNQKIADVYGEYSPCYNGDRDGFGLYVYKPAKTN